MKRKKRTDLQVRGALLRGSAGLLVACLALALLATPCAAEPGQRPEPTEADMARAREIVAKIIERYESEDSYRISSTQESYWSLADTTIISAGVLILKRPSKLVLRYDDGSMIATSGDTLTVYMSQTNQYFVTLIGEDDTVIDPPRVLRSFVPDPGGPFSGPSAAEPAVSAGGEMSTRIVQEILVLIPTDSAGEPARLEVTVDPSRSVVKGMVAHTRSGDHTRYRIQETSFGVETKPSDFVIDIPPEAERIGG